MTLDSSRLSPSKSNKVPNSLAFKRGSNEHPKEFYLDSARINRPEKDMNRFNLIEHDDENILIST
jgi:hypothetical protein